MKTISLDPYPGRVFISRDLDEVKRRYKQICRKPYPHTNDHKGGGRYIKIDYSDGSSDYLVWWSSHQGLAHEVCHVLLHLFDDIGAEPSGASGEPFCYMVSKLMREATKR